MSKLTRRAPTLESGRGRSVENGRAVYERLKKVFHLREKDGLEEELLPLAAQSPYVKRLLGYYRKIASTENGELLDDVIWLSDTEGSDTHFAYGESISQSFDNIHDYLHARSVSGLSICAVVASTKSVWKAYSFLTKVLLIIQQRSDKAGRLVRHLAGLLLARHWITQPDEAILVDWLLCHPELQSREWKPSLPSLEENGSDAALRQGTSNGTFSAGIRLPDGMFSQDWQWSRDAPAYENDVGVYVYQPFEHQPAQDFVRIVAVTPEVVGQRKAIVIVNSPNVLERLKEAYGRMIQRPRLRNDMGLELTSVVLALYECMRDDVAHFVTQAVASIEKLGLLGRTHASGWKIQYLLHLRECMQAQARICERAKTATHTLLSFTPTPSILPDTQGYSICEKLYKCEQDSTYLALELDARAISIRAVETMVLKQMELSRNFWSTVVTFVVALYVPISFASSFFGMNVIDRSTSTYWANSSTSTGKGSWSATTLLNNKTVTENATKISTNQANGTLWDIKFFWITAASLAFGTIIIPVVAGSVFRRIFRFAQRNKVWWRVIVAFLALGALAVVNIVPSVSQIMGPAIYGALAGWHILVAVKIRASRMGLAWVLIGGAGVASILFIRLSWFVGSLVAWTLVFGLWLWKRQYFFGWQRYRKRTGRARF